MILVRSMRRFYEALLTAPRLLVLVLLASLTSSLLNACSMGEEMRRIDESKRASQIKDASRSSNLTGDQLFARSCNTCHPGGKAGMGPRLDKLETDFPTDDVLKKFLRKGKGMMPAQTPEIMNDAELSSLVVYLRNMNTELNQAK